MWKIVKDELTNNKALILTGSVIFLGIILYNKIIVGHLRSIYFIGTWLVPSIIQFSIIVSIVMVVLELKEHRTRLLAPLPIPIWRIALSRVLATLVPGIIFLTIAALNDPRIIFDIIEWIYSSVYGIHGNYSWFPFTYVPYEGHPYAVSSMFFWIFGARLLTVQAGRQVLAITGFYIVLAIAIAPFISEKAFTRADILSIMTFPDPWRGTYILTLSTIAFITIIFTSFLRRKSYY